MSYKSLMVHMDLGSLNAPLLRVAALLIEKFKASALGVVACAPIQVFAGDAYISGELVDQDRLETDKLIDAAERQFRRALEGRARELSWRSMLSFEALSTCLADEARSVDIIIANQDATKADFDPARRVAIADLVMSAGRPILLIPPSLANVDLSHVLVCWKDTREARRAIVDALPLMKIAERVSVVEIAPEDDLEGARARVDDIRRLLKGHAIEAETLVRRAKGEAATQIAELIGETEAGLLVAGAYGHNRLREWALGGVTRDLLLKAPCLALVSH